MPEINISRRVRSKSWIVRLTLALTLCAMSAVLQAFPPAPYHILYGTARNEFGNPLQGENLRVIVETSSGHTLQTAIGVTTIPGANYVLHIPMDTGIMGDPYHPTAMRPTAPFRLKVLDGNQVYLPIEMVGDMKALGRPGQRTRLDLTLGEDTDGDGLPDAWERTLIAMLGLNGLEDVNPHDDLDGDGMTNLEEYMAGTYAWDPEDSFMLSIVENREEGPLMEFLAIRGRTYVVHSSDDLITWTEQSFRLETESESRRHFRATQTRQIPIIGQANGEAPVGRYFKLKVQ